MMTKTKFFLFLVVLQCPPSLLIPLAQQHLASTSNANSLVVLGPNQITPNNSKVIEFIQQIDVKDNENQVISNINHVVVSDENIQNDNNETLKNGTNNLLADKLLVAVENTSSSLNDIGVTNPLNDSSSLLLSKSLNATSGNAKDNPMQRLQNNLANETQTNPLKTTSIANVDNGAIKEVSIVQNGSTARVTTISVSNENDASLNNKTIVGEHTRTLHESLNDSEFELAWRSDIPVGKNKKVIKHIVKLDSQNATLHANNINGSVNNNSYLFDSQNDDEKRMFVILNSGNIDGISVNSPANSNNLQTNPKNNTIENHNYNNSKLINDFINLTINDVLSKMLQPNHSNFNSTHIFLLLNSGSISNVHISSPVLENIVKNTTLKDRSRRHLNVSNTNNTDVETVTLKSSSDKSNPIINVKFRTGEHQGTQNNVNKYNNVASIPLDNNQNNSTLVSNAPDNAIVTNSNDTVVDLIKDEEISSAEAPAFRSLIPDKIRKLQQVSNVVNNELNEAKDHNLVHKLLPESPPISIDLNQIPINNLLGSAFSFIRRLKRDTHDKAENSYPWKRNCKTKQIDQHRTVKSCKTSKSFNNDWIIKTIPTRKSFDDNISNVLKLYDSVELVCPLSVIVKLYTHQVLENFTKSDVDGVLNKIISSFVNGNEDAINLISEELSDVPIPIKLRLQLVHGKTKEFMEQLSGIVDATLCSLS